MAFSTLLALSLFSAGSALALHLSDNQWAKEHAWLLPVLWGLSVLFALAAIVSARWFRNLFLSQEAGNQEASRQEVHNSSVGGDIKQAGRDYHETHINQIRERLPIEPVLRFEPDFGSLECVAKQAGDFILLLVNAGSEHVEQIRLYIVYFVAQKLEKAIVLKEVGRGSDHPAFLLRELNPNDQVPIELKFMEYVRIMNEVARNGNVPYLFGVKLHLRARRKVDGKDFDFYSCYQISLDGRHLICPRQTIGGMVSNVVPVIELEEIIPLINSLSHWSSVVSTTSTTKYGEIVTKYT